MESNGTGNNTQFAVAFAVLLVFGFFYNHLVERFQKRTQRYTAELVVGGVLATVLVSGFFIGWINAVKVLLLFGASGFFMIIGSWLRAARDDEQAKEITKGNGK